MAANPALDRSMSPRVTSAQGTPTQTLSSTLWSTLKQWWNVTEARRYLDELDDHLLRDIGFEPDEARTEAAKYFWEPYTLAPVWDRMSPGRIQHC